MEQHIPTRWTWRGACVGGWLMTVAVVAAATGPAQTAVTTSSGVYTTEQATRGEVTFASTCQGCHTASAFTSPAFRNTWNGSSLWELYSSISDTMPEDAPGSLTAGEYAQVVAYLLKLNRAPAGATELPADEASLAKIRIDIGSVPAR